jgi:hypothetical protein
VISSHGQPVGGDSGIEGIDRAPVRHVRPKIRQMVMRLGYTLLDAEYDFRGEHRRWLTFSIPRGRDLLAALGVLAAHGFGQDPRFRSLLDSFLGRQDAQGRWLCGSVSRTWALENRNRPSKWITLDALRMLRRLGLGFLD